VQELGHLLLERGLQDQPRTEPGDVLDDLRELLVLTGQLLDLGVDPSVGDTRGDTGVRPSFVTLAV
jgi:hypothetical protein